MINTMLNNNKKHNMVTLLITRTTIVALVF